MNYFFFALLLVVTLYAFVAGGGPERIGAGAYALACIASHLLFSAPSIKYRFVETGVFIVDIVVFLAFTIIALRANRFWPLWVTALLGLGVLAHLARWAGPGAIPWAYQVIMSIWSYPILALIAVGAFRHRRRLKRFGGDPDWTDSSSHAASSAQ